MPNFLAQKGIVTMAVLAWVLGLVTYATIRAFGADPPDIPAGTATVLVALYSLPPAGFALWQWRLEKERKEKP